MSGNTVTEPPVEPPDGVELPPTPETPPAPEPLPEPPEPAPEPPASALSINPEQFAQVYRLAADAGEVQVLVEGRGPVDTTGTWEVWGIELETSGDFRTDGSGDFLFEAHVPGPQDCVLLQVYLASDPNTVFSSPPFDVISHDEQMPVIVRTIEQREQRRDAFEHYVEAGRAHSSPIPLPFRTLQMTNKEDPRWALANTLARRSLAFGSGNDASKAILLLLDIIAEPDATKTPIGRDALEGKPPPLL